MVDHAWSRPHRTLCTHAGAPHTYRLCLRCAAHERDGVISGGPDDCPGVLPPGIVAIEDRADELLIRYETPDARRGALKLPREASDV